MAKRIFKIAFLISLCLVGVVQLCTADIFDIRVNDDQTVTDQADPRIAVDHSGDFIIVWTDKRSANSDIYFQFFDSSGTASGDNYKLNNDIGSSPQYHPSVAANNLGQFAAVWQDFRNGSYPFGADIFFAPIDTLSGSDNIEITALAPDSTRESADIAVLVNGSFVSVWSDYRNKNWDIYGQIVTADGQMIQGNFIINDDIAKAAQHAPRVAALADGGFVVAWYDNRNGDDDIYAQRFDQSADPTGTNFMVNDDATGKRQAFPAIAADINGRFFVAWTDWRNGIYPANPDIYVRRYAADGTPLEASVKIVGIDGGRPQRDCAICADAMGNVCVAWADSTSDNWDVRARIIDYRGVLAPSSFLLSQEVIGKQLQPDIAADGFKMFATWSDYRNGNFDIYASIIKYNDPSLVPSVDEIIFDMEYGQPPPDPVEVFVTNAGYGALDWSATTNVSWLSVTPNSGTTPDTFSVEVLDNTFGNGDYYGQIRLVNVSQNDSTVIIPVRLTVSSPLIDIVPDTLIFPAHAAVGNPENKTIAILNAGSGTLTWHASESADWLDIFSASSGAGGDSLELGVSIFNLDPGDYWAPVEIVSAEAANSPETCWVELSLVDNKPYLAVMPDQLDFFAVVGDNPIQQLTVINGATGSLAWTALENSIWLSIDKSFGTDNDVISVGVNTENLSSGFYKTHIDIYDSASFNVSVAVPVNLYLSSGDSIVFMNSNTMPGMIGVVPIFIDLLEPAKSGYVPFASDSHIVALDSLDFSLSTWPPGVDFYQGFSGDAVGEFGFRLSPAIFDSLALPPGRYFLGNLFYTARDTNAIAVLDTLYSDSSGAYILDTFLVKNYPGIKVGSLFVGHPTAVGDDEDLLPDKMELKQNYPNPFNAQTTIAFVLDRRSQVKMEIFNILGQVVREFDFGYLGAGRHEVSWDGRVENSRTAPSGIYFYKLSGGSIRQVRKMVLLK